MKYLIVAFLLLVTPACAAEKAREVKLTTEQVGVLLDVLKSKMESYEKIVKEGDRERVVKVFYQYEIGVRMAIAKNIPPLEYAWKSADKARVDAMMALSDGTGIIPPDGPVAAKFQMAWRDILNREHTLNLITITEADLKLKDNALPASVLAALLPILE